MGRFKSKVVILTVIVFVLVLVAVLSSVLVNNKKSNSFKQIVSQIVSNNSAAVATPKDNIKKDINIAFPDPKDKGIMAYVDLAFAEKKALQSYLYINKAFDKMAASFKTAKSAEKLLTMINLQNYAKTLPNYKESDFVIPK